MKTLNRIKHLISRIKRLLNKIRHSIRYYCVFYADSTILLDKAQKSLRALPQGCELVHITQENKSQYKCKRNVNIMLSVEGEVWAVVNNNNEIIAYHYGTYINKESLFFKVKNCGYEHIEIMVDENYRRKGVAVYLLYHAVKNLKFKNEKNIKVGTVIHPNNIPSIKLHEFIGFKKSHRVIFFHWRRKKDGHYKYINIPHYTI